ncbi:tetratricopeptide repeat protein [Kangiella sp.]|uniref:tetratricopeptide repeat protein n=1 Tax=Kangiella sp. TaxID=1920245 RepID=UPI003A9504FC
MKVLLLRSLKTLLLCLLVLFNNPSKGNEQEAINYDKQLEALEFIKTSNPQRAREMLRELESSLSELSDEQKDLYKLYFAHSLAIMGEYDQSQRELENLTLTATTIDLKARAHSLLSNIYLFEGEYKDAFVHSARSLENLASLDEKKLHKFAVLQNASSLYKQSGLLSKAMEYSRQMLSIAEKQKDVLKLCVGNYEMASWEVEKSSVEIADLRLKSAEDYCDKTGDDIFKVLVAERRAEYYLLIENQDSAINILKAWEERVKEIDYKSLSNLYEIKLSEAYLAAEKIDEALVYANSAYERTKKYNDSTRLMEACKLLASIYSELNDLEKSVEYYQEYMQLEKQLEIITNQRKLAYYMASVQSD